MEQNYNSLHAHQHGLSIVILSHNPLFYISISPQFSLLEETQKASEVLSCKHKTFNLHGTWLTGGTYLHTHRFAYYSVKCKYMYREFGPKLPSPKISRLAHPSSHPQCILNLKTDTRLTPTCT